MSHLLMLSGDTLVVRGERGPFYTTLAEFAPYWDSIDVLTPPAPGAAQTKLFGNVKLYPSPQPKLAQPFFIFNQGQALARQRPYQLIVSHDYGFYLNGLGAAWLSQALGVPYVSEIHHIEGYPRAANWREKIQPTLTRWYIQWAKRRVKAFRIVNNGELKPLLLSWGVPEAQLAVLYSLYLDFEVFRPAPVEPVYTALFCGRLTPNKAPQLFLESLALARQRLGQVRGIMVGRGPLASQLKAKAQELNLQVEFVDWVENQNDLADLYRRSKCLVCTSYSEGGPRVVAEALACGLPVLTTRVGLARELVRDGENGFQTDWAAADIASRIVQLASDESLRSKLSQTAPAAVQRFEKSKIIREYALGYQQLAK
jgi:glycosyltransferase involved in cell wall biosynthesis